MRNKKYAKNMNFISVINPLYSEVIRVFSAIKYKTL
jgi:hypothetical protein